MSQDTPLGVLSLLTKREPILRAVDADGVGKRELVEQLRVSRSTIDRGIRELENAGLLARSPEGYRRTLLGELVLSQYDQFASRTDSLLAAKQLLAELSPAYGLDPVVFEEATIVTPSKHDPPQPISAFCSLLAEARWTQTVCPAVFPQLLDQWVSLCAAEQARADIVLSAPAVSTLVGSHTASLETLVAEATIALHQVETDPVCGLVVAENDATTTGGLLVLDDRGGARAFVQTDTDAGISWLRGRIDDHLRQSTPLSEQAVE